jgi:serine/threonine protein kinase
MDRIDENQQLTPPQTAAKPAHDPHVGTVIGERYEVLELVGKGGMGNVYKVRHIQLKKNLALKLLSAGKDGFDRSRLARFDSEAKAASGLNHPNLTGLHDYGTTSEGAPYLVMDYFEGETLAQRIASQGAMDEREAINVFIQLCDGLMYAHAKGIIHRDIKPSNIILTTENGKTYARIVDFGIAKTLQQPDGGQPTSATLTHTGEVVGSPPYMSPEQCLGNAIDHRTDIYSLGCTLFEALTGSPVFAGETAVAIMFKHINERPPLFKSAASEKHISHSLERVTMQMLEKAADNRYHSIADLKRDLELIRDGKNPVKEMSTMRHRVHSTLMAGKVLAQFAAVALVCSFATFLFATKYLPQNKPLWQKLTDQGQQQLDVAHNYSEAEGYFKRAALVATDNNAPSADRVWILISLARVQGHLNQPDKQLRILSDALDIPGLSSDDLSRGHIYDELALLHLERHNFIEAEKNAREAIRIKLLRLGHNDWFTAHSVARLASALQGQKRFAEAETAARDLVDIENHISPLHDKAEVADAYFILAQSLAAEGKTDEAITQAKMGHDIAQKVGGVSHPLTQRISHWLMDRKN